MSGVTIAGTGYYVPEKVLTNDMLEKGLDTSSEWIVKRTGISERRVAEPYQTSSDMALPAAQMAMKNAGITAQDVDVIVFGTITPDNACPSAACVLQAKLDAPQAICFDISAACSGFIFALEVGRRFVLTGAGNVLVVAGEIMSRMQNWTDRNNCILWGDGAGAVILRPGEENPLLLQTYLRNDGAGGKNLLVRGGGSCVTPISYTSVDRLTHGVEMIDAATTLKVAVNFFYEAAEAVVRAQGLTFADVDHFVPHQANIRFMQALSRKMKVSMDKFAITINKYGNISAASCVVTLCESVANGRIKPGDLVCMPVFGGGLTWGAALIRF